MQTKTIKKVLNKKITAWLESIEDSDLRFDLKTNIICTGGAIASMLMKERVNDYDLYFKTSSIVKRLVDYYIQQFKARHPTATIYSEVEHDRVKIIVPSQGILTEATDETEDYLNTDPEPTEEEEIPPYAPIFFTTNAITLKGSIQLVIRFTGPVEEIHENYDYVHCTCSYDYHTDTLTLPNDALLSMMAKRLRYTHSRYPLCSLIRTRKFISRGWTIDAGQYVKMAWDLNQFNLSNLDVLEDQLTGVDSAYFHEAIDKLRERQGSIDSSYLFTIIERIFE